ncbi:MAG: hypothetical protein ABI618_17485, partial [Nitrospirota bacterium]
QSLQTSMDALPETEAQRYLELAVFPEDVNIPLSTITIFWQYTGRLSELETNLLLKSFARKSFLYLGKEQDQDGVSFHDLQHEFLTIMVEDLPASHRKLLEAYKAILPGTDDSEAARWDALSEDEPYLWDHLVYHLQAAEMEGALIQLGTNLRYLAKKLWVRGSYTVESDIQQIRAIAPTHPALERLERIISQAAHLLVGQPNLESVLATWFSRVKDEPALQKEVQRLEDTFDFPYLKPVWPMPDVPDPALVRTLEGHTGGVNSCAIDPMGRWVVSGADDRTLKVWDLTTGELVRTLEGHTVGVDSCAIDLTGRWVVAGAWDGVIRVWELSGGNLFSLLRVDGLVRGAAWVPDRLQIVAVGARGIYVFELIPYPKIT